MIERFLWSAETGRICPRFIHAVAELLPDEHIRLPFAVEMVGIAMELEEANADHDAIVDRFRAELSEAFAPSKAC